MSSMNVLKCKEVRAEEFVRWQFSLRNSEDTESKVSER